VFHPLFSRLLCAPVIFSFIPDSSPLNLPLFLILFPAFCVAPLVYTVRRLLLLLPFVSPRAALSLYPGLFFVLFLLLLGCCFYLNVPYLPQHPLPLFLNPPLLFSPYPVLCLLSSFITIPFVYEVFFPLDFSFW